MGTSLRGKVAVVTLEHEALALALAAAGATVVVVGADGERAGRLLAAIEADGQGRGAYFAGVPDGGSPSEVAALVALVAEQFRDPPEQGEARP